MDKAKQKTVIVVVGMPGAGKSLASSVAAKRGVPVFVSGDIIRAEAKRKKLSASRENLGRLMLKIREEEGMGAVAKRLAPLIDKIDKTQFVYEGARSVEEIEELNKKYHVFTIAIHASPKSRFRRLQKRRDRKSTRLNSSHGYISYAVFCLKKKKKTRHAAINVMYNKSIQRSG